MLGLGAWLGAALFAQARLVLARRRRDEAWEMAVRRRLAPWLAFEHLALALTLASGLLLMLHHGWGLGQARWLAVKLGLVGFLVVPLEAMHAWVCHAWIARGLRGAPAPPFSRDLRRAIGMDDMVRTLAALLLGAGVPAIIWLSFSRPF